MRAASVQLAASIAADATTLARLWRVTRVDGAVLYFTDAVNDIVFDSNTYRSDVSFTSSAIFTSRSAANMQSVTFTVGTDDTAFAEGDIRQGKYKDATAEVSVVDFKHPEYGELLLFQGKFGTIQLTNQHLMNIEIIPNSVSGNGNSLRVETFSATCRANLGDKRCKIDLEALRTAFTVLSASGGSIVAAEFTAEATYWTLGRIKWLTGANAGTVSQVQSCAPATNNVFLLSAPFNPIQPGDTGYIYPGCDKQLQTCRDKFNNILNFRGEPHVPTGTQDQGSKALINPSRRV